MKKYSFILYLGVLLFFSSCNQEDSFEYLTNPNVINLNLNDPIPTSVIKIATNNQIHLDKYKDNVDAALTNNLTTKRNFTKADLGEILLFLGEIEEANEALKSQAQDLKDFIEIHSPEKEYSDKITSTQESLKKQVVVQALELPSIIELDKAYNPSTPFVITTAECLLREKRRFQDKTLPYIKQTIERLAENLKTLKGVKTKSQLKDEEFETIRKTNTETEKNLKAAEAQLQELKSKLNETLESKKNELQRLTEEKQAILEANGLSEEEKEKLREDLKAIEEQKSTLESDKAKFEEELNKIKKTAVEDQTTLQSKINLLQREKDAFEIEKKRKIDAITSKVILEALSICDEAANIHETSRLSLLRKYNQHVVENATQAVNRAYITARVALEVANQSGLSDKQIQARNLMSKMEALKKWVRNWQ